MFSVASKRVEFIFWCSPVPTTHKVRHHPPGKKSHAHSLSPKQFLLFLSCYGPFLSGKVNTKRNKQIHVPSNKKKQNFMLTHTHTDKKVISNGKFKNEKIQPTFYKINWIKSMLLYILIIILKIFKSKSLFWNIQSFQFQK